MIKLELLTKNGAVFIEGLEVSDLTDCKSREKVSLPNLMLNMYCTIMKTAPISFNNFTSQKCYFDKEDLLRK